jgi:hypothetical protein
MILSSKIMICDNDQCEKGKQPPLGLGEVGKVHV